MSTLFQDSAGTTPVTAVEQPVGLALDKSQGGISGTNNITNGSFATDLSSWTVTVAGGNTIVWQSPGVMRFSTDNVSAAQVTQQTDAYTTGATYIVTFTATRVSGAGNIRAQAGPLPAALIITATGNYSTVVTSPATSHFTFINHAGGACVWDISNVIVRAVPGNHATQATAGNRPTYRARYNLFTFSEDFTNAAWTKASVTPTTNATTDPLGGNTGNRWTEVAATTNHRTTIATAVYGTTVIGNTYTLSCAFKAAERSNVLAIFVVGGGFSVQNFNVSTGTVQAFQNTGGTTSISSATITAIGGGWYRCTLVISALAAGSVTAGWDIAQDNTTASSYLGDITKGIYAWGADGRFGNQPNLSYQSITTATSYNAVGFLPYLAFNGTSSAMATASIPFTGAQATMFVGLTANTTFGIVAETSNTGVGSNAGSLNLLVSAANQWQNNTSGGTIAQFINQSNVANILLPNVVTAAFDISVNGANTATLRDNAALIAGSQTPGTFATGTWTSQPLNIGARNNAASLWSNMNLYGLIVRGASSTAAEIASTESWMNGKTGAY
jgi:hypothetical protein